MVAFATHADFSASAFASQLLEAARATRVFRVWSAGCSNGEELYTLSILLHELMCACCRA